MKNNPTALVGRDFTEQKTCKIELSCTVVYQGLTVKSTPPQTQGSGIKKICREGTIKYSQKDYQSKIRGET